MPGSVIVITGPTATGKTALGVQLCLAVGGEVVSADSMQVYRGMDIGTAKAVAEEMCGVAHHMLDICTPYEAFSVSRWTQMAAQCVEDIFSRGKTPVVVGGTGLYIDSLLSGRSFASSPEDHALREELYAQYDRMGGEKFRELLAEFDPQRAAILASEDRRRLVRAVEVYRLTGETITQHDEKTRALPPRWPSLRYALSFRERDTLYARIDARVDKMRALGLTDEVRRILAGGNFSADSTAMQAIGYKEVVSYLNGDITEDEAYDGIKRSSRRYAKRQLTWLRRDAGLRWLLWDGEPDISRALGEIIDEKECRNA